MATFDEIMAAAVNAHNAGDENAARMLVGLAKGQASTPSQGTATPTPMIPTADPVGYVAPPQRSNDRFGDTIAAATKGPREATKHFAAETMNPDNSALDRVKNAGLTALSAAGTTYAFGAGLVGEAIGGSPTNEKKLARDLMMMGEVAAPELAGVSSTTRAAGTAGRAAVKAPKPLTELQSAARAADDLGITPSLGAGGKARGMTAATFEKVPLSGGVIARDSTRFVGEVEATFERLRGKVGKAQGAAGAGEALQAGLGKFVAEFRAKSSQLFEDVGRNIPDTTLIQAPETVKMIREAIAPFEGKPELMKQLGLNRWAAIADDLESGLTWKAASSLRSDIGSSIGKINGALADMDQGRLKQAYGKLTDDLETAATQAGPDAEKAWKRANNYYRRGAERIESSLDKTIKADSPERAFEAFSAMTKDGRSTSNSQRLYKIKASMPKQDWETVAASIVDRLGRAPAGAQSAAGDVFSPATFLTEWNKLSPEAKSVLLTPDVRKEMEKLAEVAGLSKKANAERNFSNTGTIVAGAGAGSALTQAPLTTMAVLGGANIASRAMTSPKFLRALNANARGDSRQLKAIASGSGPFYRDAATVLRLSAAEAAAGTGAANTNARGAQAVGQ